MIRADLGSTWNLANWGLDLQWDIEYQSHSWAFNLFNCVTAQRMVLQDMLLRSANSKHVSSSNCRKNWTCNTHLRTGFNKKQQNYFQFSCWIFVNYEGLSSQDWRDKRSNMAPAAYGNSAPGHHLFFWHISFLKIIYSSSKSNYNHS